MHAFPEECIALNAVQGICTALLLANDFYRFKPESLQKRKHYRNIAKCDLNTTKQNKQCKNYTKNVYIISR